MATGGTSEECKAFQAVTRHSRTNEVQTCSLHTVVKRLIDWHLSTMSQWKEQREGSREKTELPYMSCITCTEQCHRPRELITGVRRGERQA